MLNWVFGFLTGSLIAVASCQLILRAVCNSLTRKPGRRNILFLFGFFARFLLFAALLYLSIVRAGINPIPVAIAFTALQLTYPIYLVRKLEKRDRHV